MKRNPATNEALCALAKQGDADAQNLLIENNLRFIKKTAYELWNAQAELNLSLGIDPDDLIQEGMLGLCGCMKTTTLTAAICFLLTPALRYETPCSIISGNRIRPLRQSTGTT